VAVLVVRQRVISLGERTRRLEAERVSEPARGGSGPRVPEREAESPKVAQLVRILAAPLHPRAEPGRRHPDERRAAAVLATLRNCGLQPNPRAGRRRLEANVDRDVVERALPGQPLAGLPYGDAGQLQAFAGLGVVDLQDPAADAVLATHLDELPRVVRIDRAPHPPQVELIREGREGRPRVGGDLDRRRDGAAAQRSLRST
jgi:hypothetical protein